MLVISARVRVVVVMVSALALAAGLLTMALLSKPAQAQAETFTSSDRDAFLIAFESCTGEVLEVQGTLHAVAHTTIDPNGTFHTTFHNNIQGGAESASGAKYVFNSSSTNQQNFSVSGTPPFIATNTMSFRLIRQGSATPTDDLMVKVLIHQTVNANGEITSEVVKFEATCK